VTRPLPSKSPATPELRRCHRRPQNSSAVTPVSKLIRSVPSGRYLATLSNGQQLHVSRILPKAVRPDYRYSPTIAAR
jgi:hypothetical protein